MKPGSETDVLDSQVVFDRQQKAVEACLAYAREHKVNDDAKTYPSEAGVWVQAWVFIPFSVAGVEITGWEEPV